MIPRIAKLLYARTELKNQLNGCKLLAALTLKQTVQEIIAWDEEQVRKSSWTQVFTLFVNSIQRRKKNIYKEEPRILSASLGANSFRKDWSKIRNCGLIYQNLKLLLEIRDTVLWAKEEREYPACNQFKCHHLWWYRSALEHIVDNVHSCEGTFNTERYTSICHHDKVFFSGKWERPKSILHVLQQHNCRVRVSSAPKHI